MGRGRGGGGRSGGSRGGSGLGRTGGRGSGSVRGFGSTGSGGLGRGRSSTGSGFGGGTPRPAAPRPRSRAGSFGMGMGMGMMMGGRRRRGWGWGGGWGWRRRRPVVVVPGGGGHHHGGGGGGCGCFTILLAIFMLVLIIGVISFFTNLNTNPTTWNSQFQERNITTSTVVREPLASGLFNETTGFFTDHLDVIGNQTVLTAGMRNFQQATGVRPHLYIVDEINGNAWPSNNQLIQFAEETYHRLFDDHGHVLLVFFENYAEEFAMATWAGAQAQSVMDMEARDILMDFVELYYLDFVNFPQVEAAFSRAFDRTADRIMEQPTDNRQIWMTVIIVAGILLLALLLFNWWKQKQEQKNLEAEQTERILSQSLDTFADSPQGDDEASRLANLYSDDDNNN